MEEESIVKQLCNCAQITHLRLGRGCELQEYAKEMREEINRCSLFVAELDQVPVIYKNIVLDSGPCAQMLVDGRFYIGIITEGVFSDYHFTRMQHKMRSSMYKVALLFRFNVVVFSEACIRIENETKIFRDEAAKTDDYANFVRTLAGSYGEELGNKITRI